MAISDDDRWLANGTAEGVVEVWNLETGRIAHQLQPERPEEEQEDEGTAQSPPSPIADVAFAPGGKALAVAVDHRAVVWNLDPVEPQSPLTVKDRILAVTWGPRGKFLLAAGADKETYVWDTQAAEITLRLQGHTADVTDLALAGKGRLLVTVGLDGGLHSYATSSWAQTKFDAPEAHGGSGLTCVAGSADGKHVATGAGDGRVIVWDVRRKRAVETLEVSASPIDHVAFGTRELFVSAGGELHVYSTRGARRHKLSTISGVRVAFDGKTGRIFSGGDGIEVFDGDTGTNMLGAIGHRGPVRAVTFANGGKFVASGGDGDALHVWEARTGHELQTLKGHVGILAVAASADGGRVAVGARSHAVHVWDLLQGAERARLAGHDGLVTAVTFSPSGKRVASGGTDAAVRVWDPETGKVTQSFLGDRGHARSLAWSPDGRLLGAGLHRRWYSDDKESVVIWHVATGSRQFRVPFPDAVPLAVAFAPDSKTLAVGCSDGSIRMIDTQAGTETEKLDGHTGPVRTVAWSPDGKWLASGGNDGTVRFWNGTSGQQEFTLEGHAGTVYSVAFAPDSAYLASASADSTVLIWKLGE